MLPSPARATEVDLGELAGCFQVTYRFLEDGGHDYGPTMVLERIDGSGDAQNGLTLKHYQVDGGAAVKHFNETWQRLADGTWHEAVTGPNGEPQYECAAALVFRQWHCAVSGTPKPRRDAARSDYDLLDRESAVQITPSGWVQAERNVKRKADGTAVANEVGWVEYRRTADVRCAAPALR